MSSSAFASVSSINGPFQCPCTKCLTTRGGKTWLRPDALFRHQQTIIFQSWVLDRVGASANAAGSGLDVEQALRNVPGVVTLPFSGKIGSGHVYFLQPEEVVEEQSEDLEMEAESFDDVSEAGEEEAQLPPYYAASCTDAMDIEENALFESDEEYAETVSDDEMDFDDVPNTPCPMPAILPLPLTTRKTAHSRRSTSTSTALRAPIFVPRSTLLASTLRRQLSSQASFEASPAGIQDQDQLAGPSSRSPSPFVFAPTPGQIAIPPTPEDYWAHVVSHPRASSVGAWSFHTHAPTPVYRNSLTPEPSQPSSNSLPLALESEIGCTPAGVISGLASADPPQETEGSAEYGSGLVPASNEHLMDAIWAELLENHAAIQRGEMLFTDPTFALPDGAFSPSASSLDSFDSPSRQPSLTSSEGSSSSETDSIALPDFLIPNSDGLIPLPESMKAQLEDILERNPELKELGNWFAPLHPAELQIFGQDGLFPMMGSGYSPSGDSVASMLWARCD